jgi:hypothetical protein
MINRKYFVNEVYFEKIDTEEKAYILGILFADGHNNISNSIVSIGLMDREHVEKIRDIFYPLKDRPLYISKLSKKNENWSDSFRLTICCKRISECLLKLGMKSNKSFDISIPDTLTKSELVSHFIRGYFDGDGYFSEYKKSNDCVLAMTGNKIMLTQIQSILCEKCGVKKTKFSSTSSSEKGIFKLHYGGIKNTHKIYEFLYRNATISLDRKRQKIENYYEKYKERLNRKKSSKYKNVCFDKDRNKWSTKNIFTGKQKRFACEYDAYSYSITNPETTI